MIFYSPYVLKRRALANSQSQSLYQEGVLIKVVDSDLNLGVADLCPWPELGDLTWQQEIATKGILFQRALELASKDLQARKNKISVQLPGVFKNHQTWVVGHSQQLTDSTVVKIKGTRDLKFLNEQIQNLQKQKIRIDFNFCLTFDEFKKWIDQLSVIELKKIDVIEDPFPFKYEHWIQFQNKVKLVLDFNQSQHEWPYNVCKPSRQAVTNNFEYMTSSMDHPVGLAHGLWIASDYPHKTHGFLTLDMYETTPFHQAFQQSADSISFKSNGYGIGFDEQLNLLNWIPLVDWAGQKGFFLLANPRSTETEKSVLSELAKYVQNIYPSKDFILIPSSGSSQQSNQSLKLFLHSPQTLLSAAGRVNEYFKIQSSDRWGSLLPAYHVGGLSIYARAFLSGSDVFTTDWSSFTADWILKNHITLMSLVPTQIFDLVQKQMKCPECVRLVFVGGAALADELFLQARQLGWPIIKTYGMTETGSMIAVSDQPGSEYFILPGVDIQTTVTAAKVHTASLAAGFVQKTNGQIDFTLMNDGYELTDQIEIRDQRIRFLGRASNQIKILGEGVSLDQLRALWAGLDSKSVIVHLPDERAENKLVLVSQENINLELVQKFNQQVKPYEKLKWFYRIKEMPQTDLGKVLYSQIQQQMDPQKLQLI